MLAELALSCQQHIRPATVLFSENESESSLGGTLRVVLKADFSKSLLHGANLAGSQSQAVQ